MRGDDIESLIRVSVKRGKFNLHDSTRHDARYYGVELGNLFAEGSVSSIRFIGSVPVAAMAASCPSPHKRRNAENFQGPFGDASEHHGARCKETMPEHGVCKLASCTACTMHVIVR